MTFSVGPLEAIWIVLNLITFALTVSALVDARADREAVKLLNGHARELAASGIVRREWIRLAVQTLLLTVAIPGVFIERDIVLSVPIGALMVVPVLLLLSSFLDARDRKALTVLVAADLLADATTRFDQLERLVTENTAISTEAVVEAKRAYEEANNLNERMSAQDVQIATIGEQGVAVGERIEDTVEDTAAKVTDLHAGTAPRQRP